MPQPITVSLAFKSELSGLDRFVSAVQQRLNKVSAFNKTIENGSHALNQMLAQAATVMGVRQLATYVAEAQEAIRTQNQLNQSLRQSGNYSASNVAALNKQSEALQKVTNYSDDDITAVQSRMAAYGANITQIKQLTTAALDLAEGRNMGLSGAANFIAQVLAGDQTELSKLGITLDTTKNRADALADAISSRFGGQAQAALAFPELKEAKTNLDDTKKHAGNLAATLSPIASGFTSGLEKGIAVIRKLVSALGEVVDASDSLKSMSSILGGIASAALMVVAPMLVWRAVMVGLPVLINPLRDAYVALAGVDFFNAVRGLNALSKSTDFPIKQIWKLATWGERLSGIFALVGAAVAGWEIGRFLSQLKIADRTIDKWIQLGLASKSDAKTMYQAEAGVADENQVSGISSRTRSMRGENDKAAVMGELNQVIAEADKKIAELNAKQEAASKPKSALEVSLSSQPGGVAPVTNTFSTEDEADLERLTQKRANLANLQKALEAGQADAIISQNQELDRQAQSQARVNMLLQAELDARTKLTVLTQQRGNLDRQMTDAESNRKRINDAKSTTDENGNPAMSEAQHAAALAEVDQQEREIIAKILANEAAIVEVKDQQRQKAEALKAASLEYAATVTERVALEKQITESLKEQGTPANALHVLAGERIMLDAQTLNATRAQTAAEEQLQSVTAERTDLETRLTELWGERATATGPEIDRIEGEIALVQNQIADSVDRQKKSELAVVDALMKVLGLRKQIAENTQTSKTTGIDLTANKHNLDVQNKTTALDSTRNERQIVEQLPYSVQQHQRLLTLLQQEKTQLQGIVTAQQTYVDTAGLTGDKLEDAKATLARLKSEVDSLNLSMEQATKPKVVKSREDVDALGDNTQHYQSPGEGFEGGLNEFVSQIGTIGDQMAQMVNNVATSLSTGIGNALTNIITKAEDMRDVWNSVFTSVLSAGVNAFVQMEMSQMASQARVLLFGKAANKESVIDTVTTEGAKVAAVQTGEVATTTQVVAASTTRQVATKSEGSGNLITAALGALKSLSSIPIVGPILGIAAMAAVFAAGMALLGGFAIGGYTPEGSRDQAVGVVHADEWVAPKWMRRSAQWGPVIGQLEAVRRKGRGFATGGFVNLDPSVGLAATLESTTASATGTGSRASSAQKGGEAEEPRPQLNLAVFSEDELARTLERHPGYDAHIIRVMNENAYSMRGNG